MNQAIKIAPYLIIGALLVYMKQCQPVETIERVEIDTITVVSTDTVFVDREVPIYHTAYIDKPTVIYVDSSGLATYTDTTFMEPNFFIWYTAKVQGSLSEIDLSFYDNRPERIVTNTVEHTITEKHYISPHQWWVGSDFVTDGSIAPGLMYIRKRWAYKANYNIQRKNLTGGIYFGF